VLSCGEIEMTGREIDALVAEKIMDGKWIRYYQADYEDPDSPDGKVHALIVVGKDLEDFLSQDNYVEDTGECKRDGYNWIKEYSSDISYAWEVLEKVTGKESFAEIHRILHRNFGEEEVTVSYSVTIMRKGEDVHIYGIKLAPMAICLAALAALNIEIPEEVK